MANLIKSNTKQELNMEAGSGFQESTMAADVQSYLISSYREALKRGDKSAAKSCLLAARYFSVNDPNVTNEIYLMAKADGDVGEAAKCFANIFTDLFTTADPESRSNANNELSTIVNQLKDETRILINELKSQYLKLKSVPAPTTLTSRQAQSVNQSPTLSPRLRLSSEDRMAIRESMSKLDNHLNSSTRSIFYQQLYDNLPEDVRKNILDHSIETCDNPFEQCRLIMLTISIFRDSVSTYGGRLLRTLIELSGSPKKSDKRALITSRSSMRCRYAKSLLVLDAIPLVLSMAPISSVDIGMEDLFSHTLNYYSENCLETSCTEHKASELHEGVKKSIAARILETEHHPASEEAFEENIISILNLLSSKFIESITDTAAQDKFKSLRSVIADKGDPGTKFDKLLEVIKSLDLNDDIPEDVLFNSSRDDLNAPQPIVTPPPKGRGRPKKGQQPVIVSLDDGVKRHLQNKSREVHFVFYTILQHMFVNSTCYLKNTRSRVLMNFDNPLALQIESELAKAPSQRSSRSKGGGSQNSNDATNSPAKKARLEAQTDRAYKHNLDESPLNSEYSRKMDLHILNTLIEPHKCLEFLKSDYGVFKKLWQRFIEIRNLPELDWYRRISVDSLLISCQYDSMSEFSEANISLGEEDSDTEIRMDQTETETETSTLTITPGSSPVSVRDLRNLVQLISCHVQRTDRVKTCAKIEEFMLKIKQCGLLANDESYSSGNIIVEYMVIVQQDEHSNLGFLFFDSLSMIRYCVDLLMSILKKLITNQSITTDSAIGHAIVLSQFDWPKEARSYYQCNSWLRSHKPKSATPQCVSAATKFSYPEFFSYIKNPTIIEDFMAMLCQGYTLDIKDNNATSSLAPTQTQARVGGSSQGSGLSSRGSGGTQSRSSKVITTRGINKSFKEDLKVAMIAQMRSSCILVSLDMISNFIQTSLVPYLSSLKK